MSDYQEYLLTPTNDAPSFRFTGKLMAEASSERPGVEHWTVLKVYQTEGGKWVVEKIGEGKTGDKRITVLIFKTTERMTAKLGFGTLAEMLYRQLGIDEVKID
jgi:hypothetical protein